ncbi:hypothetical protein [Actinoplanes sp. L3-i22]|uniref:hypothetical protein n=1 Tax=Actinoplanes sp. L3-i22 TaxID=2836373 RepID=UPI001C768797|nr:hypothetical protein [Actinoplanes sp. L3-i22]BCY07321.1 hypothetical protein L3i22_024090 [Actinoplanes sp. L3-i22]
MYRLRNDIEAIKLVEGNAGEVGSFAKSARPRASFTNADGINPGSLRIYNDGPDLVVAPQQWLVKIADQLMVFSDEKFTALFEPIE